MKKIIMSFGIVALIAGTSSCTKDRTCTCTYSSTEAGAITTTSVVDFEKSSKQAAKTACAITSNDGDGKRQIMSATVHYDAVAAADSWSGLNEPAYTVTEACELK